MRRIFLVTGRPGIGKTTLVRKVAEALYDKYIIKGFITQEVREQGVRVGFKIMTIERVLGKNGKEDWLAHVSLFKGNPKIGKYNVNIEAIDEIGVKTLEESLRDNVDLVVIDEIGPMELLSRKFLPTVERVLNSDRIVLATIHIKCRQDPKLQKIVTRKDSILIELTLQNRNQMYQIVKHEIEQTLRLRRQ